MAVGRWRDRYRAVGSISSRIEMMMMMMLMVMLLLMLMLVIKGSFLSALSTALHT